MSSSLLSHISSKNILSLFSFAAIDYFDLKSFEGMACLAGLPRKIKLLGKEKEKR